jgi:hypothetical protein
MGAYYRISLSKIINRDGMDPITVTLPAVSVRATIHGSGTRGRLEGTATVNYVVIVTDWHAHPTNFRQKGSAQINIPSEGELTFKYEWDSTDGDLSHLDDCLIGEWVGYGHNTVGRFEPAPGNGLDADGVPINLYVLPQPPYGTQTAEEAYPNPDRSAPWFSAAVGILTDRHFKPPFIGPYGAADVVFSGKQVYGFRCLTCMNSDPITYFEVLMGGIEIVRTFKQKTLPPNATWEYEVKKSGATATTVVNP